MSTPIGLEALIPNEALQPFAPFLGEWRTTGIHPLMPGTTFHGRTSFACHLGGAFVIMHSEIDEPEVPNGVAVIGSDDAAGTFTMVYFDERGVSRRYDVTVADRQLAWSRDDHKLAQRNVLTLDATGDTMSGAGRMSRGGGAWEDDLALDYTRVS
jgi:hypothetical protein